MSLAVALLLLVVCSVTALATSYEGFFKDYTDDELIALNAEMANELVTRGIEKSTVIMPGEYLVGRDIPAGKYVVTVLSEEPTYIFLYEDETKEEYLYVNNYEGGIYSVTMEDGEVFQIRCEEVQLTISAGVVFQ